ncbi:predicted protein [Lichtheimia corymbifera JMRC:FSU:9682]|uniref:Uncharacterized protein n=1 Tax=Lichtheimia corymbifera JMRC:FSU:9682 TaxID=1263082 RepID=A0A068SE81_9FUNG|nr:predicted protein [Lichtheimia corymbifera JMRC:FSU:9682]
MSPIPTKGNEHRKSWMHHKNANWTFADGWRKAFGDDMDWNKLYEVDKDIGLFQSYNSKSQTNYLQTYLILYTPCLYINIFCNTINH